MTSTLKTEKIQFRGDNSDAITLSSSGGVELPSGLKANTIKHTNGTTAMTVDTSGHVTNSVRPRFGIYRKPSGTGAEQIINASNTASVSTVVGFDSGGVDENVGSHFDLANSKFTAPVSGLYQFDADILTGLTIPSSGVNWIIYFFSIDGANGRATGSPYKYIECYNSSGSAQAGESAGNYSFHTPHIGGAMYLTANQYVQLRVYCSNSVNVRIHSGIYTFWKGYLVG